MRQLLRTLSFVTILSLLAVTIAPPSTALTASVVAVVDIVWAEGHVPSEDDVGFILDRVSWENATASSLHLIPEDYEVTNASIVTVTYPVTVNTDPVEGAPPMAASAQTRCWQYSDNRYSCCDYYDNGTYYCSNYNYECHYYGGGGRRGMSGRVSSHCGWRRTEGPHDCVADGQYR